jgi:flavin reductase (DIM6/NTAB) family NADH-FMN oxidoreductase RutF
MKNAFIRAKIGGAGALLRRSIRSIWVASVSILAIATVTECMGWSVCISKLTISMKAILKKLSYGHYIVSARKPAEDMTTRREDYLAAGTVSWVMQSSFEPPMMAIAVRMDSDLHETIEKSYQFAIHVLTEGQDYLVKSFGQASEITEQTINGIDYSIDEAGLPILADVVGYIDCTLEQTMRSGDHMICLGKVRQAVLNEDTRPLNTTRSKYYYAN